MNKTIPTFFSCAQLPDGWAENVALDIGAEGTIASVATQSAPTGATDRVALPGMPNLHSHAFQRAMAGRAERASPKGDDFWAWRDVMYRFVAHLTPDQIETIATQLYIEMVKAGFTSVAEFHYLHNGPNGRPYDDPAELSERIIRAAGTAGIRLTLLPVLYQTADFGGQPATEEQRRFFLSTEAYLGLIRLLHERHGSTPSVRIGIAPHSLRAVPPDTLSSVLAEIDDIDDACPIHIHIAEQIREVDDCVAWSGARPVAWLLDNAPVDKRWVLVHATHMTEAELRGLAASGAVAGLCPTTEANLGDGLFPLHDYLAAGGAFGIGSDSNISVNPVEELRWLDYGQRLVRRKRSLTRAGPPDSIGESITNSIGAGLWRGALTGGARALGAPVGVLAEGHAADLIMVDPEHPALASRQGDLLLDALIFAASDSPITDVMVAGRWVVKDGIHRAEETVTPKFRTVLRELDLARD